jgi:hypothetical protein
MEKLKQGLQALGKRLKAHHLLLFPSADTHMPDTMCIS